MFGSGSSPAFGAGFTPMSGSSPLFGSSSNPPIFGSGTSASAFGATSSPSLFGSTPFGQSTSLVFGQTQSSLFGQSAPQQASPFGQSATSPAFGQTQSSLFGQSTPHQASPFGQSATSLAFGQTQSSLFGQTPQQASPFGQTPVFGQTQSPLLSGTQLVPFGQSQQSTSGFSQTQPSMFGTPQQPFLNSGQLTTQMAPVAPLAIPLPDRDIQAIVDAYKDEPGNPKYGFKYLLLSVTDPSMRIKPVGVSDVMRIVEALEQKWSCIPTTKGEAHLRILARQLQGASAELPRRVYTLLSVSRLQAQIGGVHTLLPGLAKIDERSLGDMHEVLRQQTEAISRLVSTLKKDTRNTEIIMSEDTDMIDESVESGFRRSGRNGLLPSYNGNGLSGY